VLLVVGEDLADRLDSGVGLGSVLLAGGLLVPVEDTADEGRDEGDASLGTGDGLAETEEKGEVAAGAGISCRSVKLIVEPCDACAHATHDW
jgi:hypothetical protein